MLFLEADKADLNAMEIKNALKKNFFFFKCINLILMCVL